MDIKKLLSEVRAALATCYCGETEAGEFEYRYDEDQIEAASAKIDQFLTLPEPKPSAFKITHTEGSSALIFPDFLQNLNDYYRDNAVPLFESPCTLKDSANSAYIPIDLKKLLADVASYLNGVAYGARNGTERALLERIKVELDKTATSAERAPYSGNDNPIK